MFVLSDAFSPGYTSDNASWESLCYRLHIVGLGCFFKIITILPVAVVTSVLTTIFLPTRLNGDTFQPTRL